MKFVVGVVLIIVLACQASNGNETSDATTAYVQVLQKFLTTLRQRAGLVRVLPRNVLRAIGDHMDDALLRFQLITLGLFVSYSDVNCLGDINIGRLDVFREYIKENLQPKAESINLVNGALIVVELGGLGQGPFRELMLGIEELSGVQYDELNDLSGGGEFSPPRDTECGDNSQILNQQRHALNASFTQTIEAYNGLNLL